jgi:tetratricopeptide (TPR) repeat protein
MEGTSTGQAKYYAKALAINLKKILDRTVDSYISVFTLNPEESREVLLEFSAEMEQKGNYQGAGEVYKKILASEPTNVDALFKLGKVLTKVVILDGTIAQAFYLLGSAHFALDENQEAMKALRKAVELNPGYAEAYYKMGLILDARGEHDQAIEAYQKTISFSPEFQRAYQSLGFAYESKGLRNEAVKYFKKAIDIEERRGAK